MSMYVDRAKGFLGAAHGAVPLPPWLTEQDIDVFAAEYARTGFRGGLNWYRNIDRNWELTAPWHAREDHAARAVHRRHARRGDHRLDGAARARRDGERRAEPARARS